MTTTISPREHDGAEAALYGELARAQRDLSAAWERAHRDAGDKKIDRWTSRERWGMTNSQALSKLDTLAAQHNPDHALHGDSPINVIRRIQRLTSSVESLVASIAEAEAVYREHRWSRFILCVSSNGHIHRYTGCHTLYATSILEWHPELSGKTEAQAVADLGPILCTHCFSSAPAEYKRNPAEVRRERGNPERDAARAAREEAKARKNLTGQQQFRDAHGGRVTTVAAAKEALRDVMRFRHYSGPGKAHSYYQDAVKAARTAEAILLARESEKRGTGATQTEIDKIYANAEKAQLKYFK